jgi:uncharacterized membrane protein YhhN
LKKADTSLFLIAYFLVAVIHLIAILIGDKGEMAEMVTKPLLMLLLILFFFLATKGTQNIFRNLVLLGLLFSWMGDVVLLFQERNPNFFLGGLVSFLIAQICYTLAFRQISTHHSPTLIQEKGWMLIPFLVYGMGFYFLIKGGLGTMRIPVIIYEVVILLMGITAMNRSRRVGDSSFIFVFAGALCFILSDSLLAVNKFSQPLPFSGFFIMLTYIMAQYLIIRGSWKQIEWERIQM